MSTVGLDEEAVKKYIREEAAEDARLEQLNLVHGGKSPSGGSRSSPLGGLIGICPRFCRGAFNSVSAVSHHRRARLTAIGE